MLTLVVSVTFALFGLGNAAALARQNTTDGGGNGLENDSFGKLFNREFYLKAHSYMKVSKAFKNFTFKDTINFIDDIESWKAPEDYTDKFPFALSGYDYEGRPIWITEIGKYNVKEFLTQHPDSASTLERYAFKACIQILSSMNNTDKGEEAKEYILITDWEGMDITQIAHVPTMTFLLNFLRNYLEIISVALHQVLAINANYATELFFQLSRPVLGGFFEKIEIFGNNKAKWIPVLRKLFPPESIPSWYGGREDWKPLQIFG